MACFCNEQDLMNASKLYSLTVYLLISVAPKHRTLTQTKNIYCFSKPLPEEAHFGRTKRKLGCSLIIVRSNPSFRIDGFSGLGKPF